MKKAICFLLAICLHFQVNLQGKEYYLCATAIFQDEAPYLKEWIEFHLLVGVEHFWLYNNESHDNYKEVLDPYIKQGIVELIEWPSKHDWNRFCFKTQPRAYRNAIRRSRSKTTWLAIIDLDEFLFPVNEKNLQDCLKKHYKTCSGVLVNWQLYGTSWVPFIPKNKTMIETLLLKAPTHYSRNTTCKSIVKPDLVAHCSNPHFCSFKRGYYAVMADGEPYIPHSQSEIFIDTIRINHYWMRDEDYLYHVKIPRYTAFHNGDNANWILSIVPELNQETDDSILKYVPALRKRMGFD